MIFNITVIHEMGLYSEYKINSDSEYHAKKEAKQNFVNDFCNGKTSYKIITKITK